MEAFQFRTTQHLAELEARVFYLASIFDLFLDTLPAETFDRAGIDRTGLFNILTDRPVDSDR